MYINKESWLCMLGKMSKQVEEFDGIYKYKTKTTNFLVSKKLTDDDIVFFKKYIPFNFYYLSKDNAFFLRDKLKAKFMAKPSVEIHLTNLEYKGSEYKSIRWCINKTEKYDLEISENLDLSTLKEFQHRWEATCGQKYFQVHANKNVFYFNNGHHHGKINIFCYIGGKLVSFGVLSNPENGYSSYICGKALCYDYPGLSEYTDTLLYKKGMELGVKIVNLGFAEKGLLWYKMKFPGAKKVYHYDGRVE